MIEIRHMALLLGSSILGGSIFLAPVSGQKKPTKPKPPSYDQSVLPMVDKYCSGCHSGKRAPAGIVLTDYPNAASVVKNATLWSRVARNVSSGHMPPDGMPKPSAQERAAMVSWLETTLTGDCKLKDPGRVTMRRLNRHEYNNTVRDLIGLDLKLADDFPSDDVGYGFDNIGDVLSISPLLMEKYLRAAEMISQRAVVVPQSTPMRFESGALKLTSGVSVSEQGALFFFSNGEASIEKYFTMAGDYRMRTVAYGQQAGPEPTKLAFMVDGQPVKSVDVRAVEAHPETYEAVVSLDAGKHRFGIAFTNDYYKPGPPPEDRNLVASYLEIVRPAMKASALPESHRAIVTEVPTGTDWKPAATHVLTNFAYRAFRRPASAGEMGRLIAMVEYVQKDGQPYERAIQLGVQAILSSPHFLFRVEADNASTSLSGYELASRLSYFLWGSMPDQELFRLAASGQLQKPAVLKLQVKRMLADPKVDSLADNFAEEWLNLRKLALINPDPAQFPDFNEKLRTDMLTETKLFFNGVVKNDRSVVDFINAKYSYINESLAKHYGIEGVVGDNFRKVALTGTPRSGLLTQGSILTLTSNPTRTSPVKRGKWILEQILNAPLPPPSAKCGSVAR